MLLSGWPLDSRSWEPSCTPLLEAGHRVVRYDRRGFGRSSRPIVGYDFDTLAGDLNKVLTELDLREVTLVGFSLGTGEVARYIGTYGTERLRPASSSRASRRPSSSRRRTRKGWIGRRSTASARQSSTTGRVAHRTLGDFLNLDDYLGKRVSKETVRNDVEPGAGASPWATWACPLTWLDDFQEDIKRIDVPTLILHGTADRILSVEGQGRRLHAAIPDAHYVEIEGGPHVMCVTHAAEVNRELLAFLGGTEPTEEIRVDARTARRPAGHAQATELHRAGPPSRAGRSSWYSPRSRRESSPVGTCTRARRSATSSPAPSKCRSRGTRRLILKAGDPSDAARRLPHNALDLGPDTGMMLSTYIVEPDEPLATFTRSE